MSVLHVDFVPRMLQSELQFSTLSLTCSSGGPKYDNFSVIMGRANDWLKKRGETVRVLHVEILEIDGIYTTNSSSRQKSTKDKEPKEAPPNSLSAYLKMIRLWYVKMDSIDENTQDPGAGEQIDYIHILPSRLESAPRSQCPKFQSMSLTFESLNSRLKNEEIKIPGLVVSIQTALLRFTAENCFLDPDRTFWMFDGPAHDIHLCLFATVFFLRSAENMSSKFIHLLGFKDFAPRCDSANGRRKSMSVGGVSEVIDGVKDWLSSAEGLNAHIINLQTIDHYSYFRSARDTPGYEQRTLSNTHFRAVLGTESIQVTKVLRLYYCSCLACQSSSLTTPTIPSTQSSPALLQGAEFQLSWAKPLTKPIVQKSFHVDGLVPVCEVNLSWFHLAYPTDSHRQLLSRINDWIASNGAALLGVETIKVCLTEARRFSRLTSEDSLFHSSCRHSAGAVYALRLYVTLPETRLKQDPACLHAEPRYVSLSNHPSCLIL